MAFAKNFVFGAASSAYQIEGAWNIDGKGPSVWDDFCHNLGHIAHNDNGDEACDFFHRYKEDIKLMADLGLKAYRFSISWPRIFPEGRRNVNEKGFEFYDKLVDTLLSYGIEPYATLFHWDMPLALEKRGGWHSRSTAEAFADYAALTAWHFNGRIKNWFTINEAQVVIDLGYKQGLHAPGNKFKTEELLICMHNMLLAHGLAVNEIRANTTFDVNIGIASTGKLCYPNSQSLEAKKAAIKESFSVTDQNWTFSHNWVLDPIIKGSYPSSETNSEELLYFINSKSEAEMKLLCPKIDMIGLNIYNGTEVDEKGKEVPHCPGSPRTSLKWPITPEVMHYGPLAIFERYNLPIFITENGQACNDRIFLDQKVHDADRIDFLARYLGELSKATEEKTEDNKNVDIRGYFHWSLTDNFEWHSGYDERFGLIYVDYKTQKRILKDSALWYKEYISSQHNFLQTKA